MIEIGTPINNRLFYRNRRSDINTNGISTTLTLGVISAEFYEDNIEFFKSININNLFGVFRSPQDGYGSENWKTLMVTEVEKVCLKVIGFSVEPQLLIGHDHPDRFIVRVTIQPAGQQHMRDSLNVLLQQEDITVSARMTQVIPLDGLEHRKLKQLIAVDVVY